MYCILLTGIPTTEKMKLAEFLETNLEILMISEQRIRELLCADKEKSGTACRNVMRYMAEQAMKQKQPFILETNPAGDEADELLAVIKDASYTPVMVPFSSEHEMNRKEILKQVIPYGSKPVQEAQNELMVNEGLKLAMAEVLPEHSIQVFLQYLGTHLGSDRVYIFEENKEETFDNTYEWCREGVNPQKDSLQGVPFEVVSLWYEAFHKNKNVIIKDVEEVKETDPLIYEYLKPQNIYSLVADPIMNNGEIIGFYGVDNPPKEKLEHISTLFSIIGQFISSLLSRRNLIQQLEILSMYDQLTQIGNRYALEKYRTEMLQGESVGILYCDVMGLKRVNDTMGHKEGDNLLIRASDVLKRQFGSHVLFRMGGDEFVAICRNIDRENMQKKVALVSRNMEEESAAMALGCVWEPDYKGNFEELLIKADDRMYEDKRRRYEDMKKA